MAYSFFRKNAYINRLRISLDIRYMDLRTESFFYHIWAMYQCVEF